MIFPEGGRVSGPELGKAKSGVGFLAVETGVTVVPMYIRGSNALRKSIFKRGHLAVVHGRPMRFNGASVEDFRTPDGFKAYSEMVMEAIRALQDEMAGFGRP